MTETQYQIADAIIQSLRDGDIIISSNLKREKGFESSVQEIKVVCEILYRNGLITTEPLPGIVYKDIMQISPTDLGLIFKSRNVRYKVFEQELATAEGKRVEEAKEAAYIEALKKQELETKVNVLNPEQRHFWGISPRIAIIGAILLAISIILKLLGI